MGNHRQSGGKTMNPGNAPITERRKDMSQDSYGSTMREKMKESMSEPFVPLNRRKNDTLKIYGERRRNGLKAWWVAHHEVVGLVAWSVMILMICAGLWWVYGILPR